MSEGFGVDQAKQNMGYDARDDCFASCSLLKDLRLEIDNNGGDLYFFLCFWVYLSGSTSCPATILRQGNAAMTRGTPFLILNEEKKLILLSRQTFHEDPPYPSDSASVTEAPSTSSKTDFPLEKWVHVGCEVSRSYIRLHLDGKIVGEKSFDSLQEKESDLRNFRTVIFSTVDGDSKGIQGCVYNTKVLPLSSAITDHYVKDPPPQLSIDASSASEIEVDVDGVWSIVGGKASCRRNFSLDVVLRDAFGEYVNKEMEVVAALVYADDMTRVEKPDDAEAPLLISQDGLEFPSHGSPIKLLNGRSSFKLKISQLSSKCDCRLFRIKFGIAKAGIFPFLEAFSPPIRCISRSRNGKMSVITWKKLSAGVHLVNGSTSPGHVDTYPELQQNLICAARPSPPSKRVKLGPHGVFLEQPTGERNSHAWVPSKVQNGNETVEGRRENFGETENSSSDTESHGARSSVFRTGSCTREMISDLIVFKYCLGSLSERSAMLKEIAPYISEQGMVDFAEQVSLYTGCSRHRHQILIAKKLLVEGERAWNLVSRNNHHVQWENVVFEIEEHFMKISCCSARSLSQQDLNFLRRTSGCHEYITRENFDKMWRWLYPVAFMISTDCINKLWSSTAPKWIEGFITKEEVEYALQSPMGIQEPGTFVLRFPTSRSWPHPDAGSLVVTYVNRDYTLHHRVLSLDYSLEKLVTRAKPLEELLLAEPELSRLGRIRRADLTA